ncbi:hypothetical protein M3Y95_00215300 [Aphelenchoides besseyi]|nr:hypothetical protein M3Y95_00215300 [Aphelenchoides besseyi]
MGSLLLGAIQFIGFCGLIAANSQTAIKIEASSHRQTRQLPWGGLPAYSSPFFDTLLPRQYSPPCEAPCAQQLPPPPASVLSANPIGFYIAVPPQFAPIPPSAYSPAQLPPSPSIAPVAANPIPTVPSHLAPAYSPFPTAIPIYLRAQLPQRLGLIAHVPPPMPQPIVPPPPQPLPIAPQAAPIPSPLTFIPAGVSVKLFSPIAPIFRSPAPLPLSEPPCPCLNFNEPPIQPPCACQPIPQPPPVPFQQAPIPPCPCGLPPPIGPPPPGPLPCNCNQPPPFGELPPPPPLNSPYYSQFGARKSRDSVKEGTTTVEPEKKNA